MPILLVAALGWGLLFLDQWDAPAGTPALQRTPTAPVDAPETPSTAPLPPLPGPYCCLNVGDRLERYLPGGVADVLKVDLAAGELLEVTFEQNQLDVVVSLADPSGETVLELDRLGTHEPERLVFVAGSPGRHTVEVTALDSTEEGGYEAVVVARRTADATDRLQARAVSLTSRGHVLRRAGQHAEAIDRYVEADALWSRLGATARRTEVLRKKADCLERLGQAAAAEETLREIVDLTTRLWDHASRGSALSELGRFLRARGRWDEARGTYEASVEAWRRAGEPDGLAASLGHLANLHRVRYSLAQAEVLYREAAELWDRIEKNEDLATTLTNLVGIYAVTGQYELALDHLARVDRLLGDEADRTFLLTQRGLVHRRRGDPLSAFADYRRAIRQVETTGQGTEHLPVAYEGLGRLYDAEGAHDRAADAYRTALDLLDDRSAFLRGVLLRNLGWVELHRGNLPAARARFEEALALRDDEASSTLGLARIERRLGRFELSAAAMEAALDSFERTRESIERTDLRGEILADQKTAYDLAVEIYVDLDRRRPGEGFDLLAFETSERGRGRWLLEDLTVPKAPAVDTDARSHALRSSRISRLEVQRLRGRQAGAGAARLDLLDRELRTELDRHRSVRPASWVMDGAGLARPLTTAEIRRALLPPGAVLLSYHVGEDRSFLFVVTDTDLEIFPLEGESVLAERAEGVQTLLAESLHRGVSRQVDLLSEELSQLLLAPARRWIEGSERLLVRLDGPLHGLPLMSLPLPGETLPVLAKREVVYVPSASAAVWLDLRSAERSFEPGGARIAVFADPVLDPQDERLSGVAKPRLAELERSISAWTSFDRLPFAGLEGEAILGRFPAGQRLDRSGFAADKELAVSGELARLPVIHFATHGLLSEEHSELSALVLSRLDAEGGLRDGFLWAYEIADLELSAELVVLSACDSGLGSPLRGEGLVGLSHAFFRAGASRVLASLWRVDDEAAAALMEELYEGYLDHGLSPARALGKAQMEIRRIPRWQSPYFWAGYVLQGAAGYTLSEESGFHRLAQGRATGPVDTHHDQEEATR